MQRKEEEVTIMTYIRFQKDEDKLCLVIKGHSGAGQAGNDLACAGISTLYYAALDCMYEMDKDGKGELEYKIRDGYARISIITKHEFYAEALQILKVAEAGFRRIAQKYPNNVQLISFDS